jgi:UPF0755 protein
MNQMVKVLIGAAVVLAASAAVCLGALLIISGGNPARYVQTAIIRLSLTGRTDDLNRSVSTDTSPVRFEILPGDTPRAIARRLADQGLILDPDLFVDYVRVSEIDRQLEAGTYFLTRAQSLVEIASALTDSRSSQFPFRILEGWRLEEIAAAIDANPYFGFSGADFLAVVGPNAEVDPDFAAFVGLPAGASLEGFMFPDTYRLPAQVTPTMLRDILLDTFIEQTRELQPLAIAEGITLREAVILASIIQREAVHPAEHAMISSVYRNRLAIGMKLDADPTVQYGIGFQDGSWWPRITQADYMAAVSPFNTYLNTGLPPGPIASPGLSAIRAAIAPAESPYYYFRAACDGSGFHVFARTYAEHLANAC